MLRKLAITGAAVAAALVAFSPLASAAPAAKYDDDSETFVQDVGNVRGDQFGLVNVDDVNVLNQADTALGSVLGILGGGSAQAGD